MKLNIIKKILNIIFFTFIIFMCITFLYKYYECPFVKFFGINCPGCGMTRAAVSLLKLDLKAAFNYNPSIFFILIIILLALKNYIFSTLTYKNIYDYIIIVSVFMFIVWCIRIFLQLNC